MSRSSYIGITVSTILLGLALAMWLPLTAEDLVLNWGTWRLSLHLSGTLLIGVVLVALASTGMDAVIRPLFGARGRIGDRVPLWVLPALVSVAGLLALDDLWWGYQLAIIGATGIVLAGAMLAGYHAANTASSHRSLARLTLQLLAYVVAMRLFTSLYGSRIRGILLGSGALALGGGLALVLLGGDEVRSRRVWLYAGIVGLAMGQLMLALNYYLLDERLAGALLLLVFYTLAGLAQQHLWERLTLRVALEYGATLLIGVGAIALLNRWIAL